MDNLDRQRILHICSYCEDVKAFLDRFGRDYEIFIGDRAYFNAVSMCILQIGELANSLSEDFRQKTSAQMPWRMIRGMRNLLAHAYGEVDEEIVWETANNDIPKLYAFCNDVINSED